MEDNVPDDFEYLCRQFAEFRSPLPSYSRLPESLCVVHNKLATRYGVYSTVRVRHAV